MPMTFISTLVGAVKASSTEGEYREVASVSSRYIFLKRKTLELTVAISKKKNTRTDSSDF